MPTLNNSYWDLIEPIWESVSIYDGPEAFLRQFDQITPKQQVLFSGHWAQSEIVNGGLFQLFANKTGVLAPEAVIAFDSLGLRDAAACLDQAMEIFGKTYPRERDTRLARLWDLCFGDEENPDQANSSEDMFLDLFIYLNLDRNEKVGNPFESYDDEIRGLLSIENGGFVSAADFFANYH